MHVRTSLVVVVAAAAVAVSAGGAAGLAGNPCGTISTAGHTWVVAAHGVSCSGAKKLIRSLAAKPLPRGPVGAYDGTFLGMRCVHLPAGAGFIACGSTNKGVQAAAR